MKVGPETKVQVLTFTLKHFWRHSTRYNDIQHDNATLKIIKKLNETLSIIAKHYYYYHVGVTCKPFMLNVIMLCHGTTFSNAHRGQTLLLVLE